ncbi:MAG: hypothetical protein ACOYL6_17450 [Bacteriovoracaceae bacterium]
MKTFALVGEDTALMIELVTTTSSQLNELEKLVSNAEKYTAKMERYNELFQDHYLRAQRVEYLALELSSKKEMNDLGTLNSLIRDLKYSMEELRERMKEYAEIKDKDDKTKIYVKQQKVINEHEKKVATTQVHHSIEANNTGRATQLTAQNTALIYENQLRSTDIQLEMLKAQTTANKLKAEEMEERRLDELQRMKAYNIRPTKVNSDKGIIR